MTIRLERTAVGRITVREFIMGKFIISAVLATAAFASPALAEDEVNWDGVYVGVSAGYTETKSDTAVTLGGAWASETTALQTFVASNWSAKQSFGKENFGGQIGFNHQIGGAVIGLEANASALSGSNVRNTGPLPAPSPTYTFTNTVDPKALYSIEAKAGVAMGKTLFYAHGGWAWVSANLSTDVVSSGSYSKVGGVDSTLDGFIVGGGIEHKFSQHVSLRVDYSYTDQGDVNYVTTFRNGNFPTYTESVNQDLRLHLVRVGMNYHF